MSTRRTTSSHFGKPSVATPQALQERPAFDDAGKLSAVAVTVVAVAPLAAATEGFPRPRLSPPNAGRRAGKMLSLPLPVLLFGCPVLKEGGDDSLSGCADAVAEA